MSEEEGPVEETISQVVSVVSAYVSHNSMRATDLPEFIGAVYASLRRLSDGHAATEQKQPDVPAVPVKRSVTRNFIVCLEDGKKFKSLRRHLSSFHHLTPDEYRAKWNLPSDYPMVAPNYSETRSQLAKESGLGQITRSADEPDGRTVEDGVADATSAPAKTTVEAPPEHAEARPEDAETPKKAGRGRPRKSK